MEVKEILKGNETDLVNTFVQLIQSKEEQKKRNRAVTGEAKLKSKIESLRTFRGYTVRDVIHRDARGTLHILPGLVHRNNLFYVADKPHYKRIESLTTINFNSREAVTGYYCTEWCPCTLDTGVENLTEEEIKKCRDLEYERGNLERDWTTFNVIGLGNDQLIMLAIVGFLGFLGGMGFGSVVGTVILNSIMGAVV